MSELSAEIAGNMPHSGEDLQYLPKKHVMVPIHVMSGLLLRDTKVFLDEGLKEELRDHRQNGGNLLILMTHESRWEPIVMAKIAVQVKELRHLIVNTGITAREELFDLPYGGGYIVSNSGAQKIKRGHENKNETPEDKQKRKDNNEKQMQDAGALYLGNGYHWLIYPEGESRETHIIDGEEVRLPRKPGKVLYAHRGFVLALEALTPEQLEKVKILGIGVHHGDRKLSRIRSTVFIPRLVTPKMGDREETRLQGQHLLEKAMAGAVLLDQKR